jgi:hypothetical protein
MSPDLPTDVTWPVTLPLQPHPIATLPTDVTHQSEGLQLVSADLDLLDFARRRSESHSADSDLLSTIGLPDTRLQRRYVMSPSSAHCKIE